MGSCGAGGVQRLICSHERQHDGGIAKRICKRIGASHAGGGTGLAPVGDIERDDLATRAKRLAEDAACLAKSDERYHGREPRHRTWRCPIGKRERA